MVKSRNNLSSKTVILHAKSSSVNPPLILVADYREQDNSLQLL